MRVIATDNRRDYYDGVMSQGYDDHVVYVRNTLPLAVDERYRRPCDDSLRFLANLPIIHSLDARQHRIIFDPFIIVFCGKEYHGVRVNDYEPGHPTTTECFYDFESWWQWVDCHGYADIRQPWRWRYEKRTAEEFLASPIDRTDLMIEKQIAIVVSQREWGTDDQYYRQRLEVTKDPILKPFEFYKVFDTYRAFQELEMFLGNLAAPENNTVVIDDKYKIGEHGFDDWSFRKMPTKKR